MKYFLLAAILSLFFAPAGFCETGTLGSKVTLIKSDTVSKRANIHSSFGSESERDPIIDASMNGMANYLQGMSGYTNNIYAAKEQCNQQAEYVKQQMKNTEMDDE